MTPAVKALLSASLLVAAGASVLTWGPSRAQGTYVPPTVIQQVSLGNETIFTDTRISNISELASAITEPLLAPTCSGVAGRYFTGLGTTATQLTSTVDGGLPAFSQATVTNLSMGTEACCDVQEADGGLPNCTTTGTPVMPRAATSFTGLNGAALFCRFSAGTGTLNVKGTTCTP